MKFRRVRSALVSAAFLAAFATTCGAAFASSSSPHSELARAGFAALQQGDTEGAIVKFTTAIESRTLEPEMLANALLNRALAFQQQGKDGLAVDDYTAALSLDAMSPELRATALYNRGLSRQKQGDLPIAIQDFTSALLLNPHFAQAFFSRGNALRDSGQLLFALSDYERALRNKHPDPARVHYGSAMTYLALRRPQDAKRSLAAALAARPNFAAAQQELAKLSSQSEASIEQTEADPILTGSVAAFSGGTVAKKPDLPKAVDVPERLAVAAAPAPAPASTGKRKKKILDRLPGIEQAAAVSANAPLPVTKAEAPKIKPQKPSADETEVAIDVDSVPAIPEPEAKSAEKVATSAEAEPVETGSIAPVASEPASAAAEESAARKPSGWMVQLASAVSEDAAWSTWKNMQKKNAALKDLKPIVVKADLGTKGVFYRVRLDSFEGQGAAKDACAKLKKSGVNCFVSKS